MALRTPPLQLRSQFGSYWGSYANGSTALPNQSANALPVNLFALEAGDVAYAAGSLWLCTSPGTAGGGDATWIAVGSSGPALVEGVRGFTGANYLESPVGAYPGVSTGFTVAALVRPRRQNVGDEVIAHTANTFVNHTGWILGHLDTFGYYFSLGDGVGSVQFIIGPANSVFANAGKLALIHGVYTAGGEVRGYANGSRTPGTVPQAFAATGGTMRVGVGPFNILPAEEIDILGVAYIERGLTDDEAFEHWNACAEAQELVQGALAWDELNRGSVVAGVVPSAVGGVALSEVGALVNTDVPIVWR